MFILSRQNSIANRFLAELRDVDKQSDPMRFRSNLERLGEIMAYEVSKMLPNKEASIDTPLGRKVTKINSEKPVLITILRAGLPFYQGFLNYFDDAESGFIGAYRKEGDVKSLEIFMGYKAAPSLKDRYVLLIDPMLATGKSIVESVKTISESSKPKHIFICSVIAAPEGIDYIGRNISTDHSIWVGDVDEKLDNNAYIVPGLGDAGDLSFGTKM